MFDWLKKKRCSKNVPKVNSISYSPRDLDFKRTYLPDNVIMTVFVSLKTSFSTTRKCVK